MPLSRPSLDLSGSRFRLISALLFFSAPFFLGLWGIYSSHMKGLEQQSERLANQAIGLMESMLQHAEEANRTMLPFAGRSCDDAMFTLRQQAALIPFVRTISLVEGQTIYCNSLFGTVQWPELGTDYSDGRLRLMPGSQVREEHPLLALRSGRGERAVASTVDGEYLRFMLAIRDQPCELLLHVGGGGLMSGASC